MAAVLHEPVGAGGLGHRQGLVHDRPHPALGDAAAALCAPGQAVQRRTSPGAGGPEQVAKQLAKFQKQLDATLTRLPDA